MTVKKKYSKLIKAGFVVLILLAGFFTYVEIANRNSKNMTYRQKFLKAVYPVWMWWAKTKGKNTKSLQDKKTAPVSFYSLKDTLISGEAFDLVQLKGKKVMLVNTASNCGYTDQYESLQKLYNNYSDKLVVIGFPANDFKEQEKGSNSEIAAFCKANFGVSFPLMQKSSVIKGPQQNGIFKWLTDPASNGWNDQQPTWNFCKYVIDEQGNLTHFFGSSVDPMSKEVLDAIK